jgi:hypothetical protein
MRIRGAYSVHADGRHRGGTDASCATFGRLRFLSSNAFHQSHTYLIEAQSAKKRRGQDSNLRPQRGRAIRDWKSVLNSRRNHLATTPVNADLNVIIYLHLCEHTSTRPKSANRMQVGGVTKWEDVEKGTKRENNLKTTKKWRHMDCPAAQNGSLFTRHSSITFQDWHTYCR